MTARKDAGRRGMPRLPIVRLPRLRRPRAARRPAEVAAAELGATLRAFRAAALWGITVLILTAAGSAFAESYRGLWLWAQRHGLAGFWAAAFPLQVDLFVAVGELVLFVAMTDRWSRRDRAGAWAVALLGLAASVAGNVGHVAAHDLQSRGTAAVPPLAAFAALWLGLGVLKRVVRRGHATAPAPVAAVPAADAEDATTDQAPVVLADLADAVRLLAARGDGPISAGATGGDDNAQLGELLDAVRGLTERVGDMVSAAVPSGAEHAALIAYRASVAAGNPYSANALQARFGLTRAQAARVRTTTRDDTDPAAPGQTVTEKASVAERRALATTGASSAHSGA